MTEKNEQEISQIIEENLEAILSGKSSLEEVLRRNPQHAVDLRRELEPALWLVSRQKMVQTRPGFTASSKKRIVERVKEEAQKPAKKWAFLSITWNSRRFALQMAVALVVVVILVAGLGGAVSYAQNALPGQPGYGVKRFGESVSYSLAGSDLRKVELGMQFIDRRFSEVEGLVALNDFTFVNTTLAEYDETVEDAVMTLRQVDDAQSAKRNFLAGQLNQGLLKKADLLADLAVSVPEEFRDRFTAARELTLFNAAAALGVKEGFDGYLDTVMPTASATATATATPTATMTLRSFKTPEPVIEQGETDNPEEVTEATEKEKKPTITPRPTNVNRPTQQIKETKEPKPPKEKPTKTDKKDS